MHVAMHLQQGAACMKHAVVVNLVNRSFLSGSRSGDRQSLFYEQAMSHMWISYI